VVAALAGHFLKAHTMLALVVEFRIHAAHVETFAEAIALNARASVAEEAGCHQFDVCRDPAEPSLFFLYELYDDDAAIAAHLVSPHYVAMDALTKTWVAQKTVRRLSRSVG
jgi:(4S)-4-hydroxy-5-phosphonooxypentane-2,3-dione isomerase